MDKSFKVCILQHFSHPPKNCVGVGRNCYRRGIFYEAQTFGDFNPKILLSNIESTLVASGDLNRSTSSTFAWISIETSRRVSELANARSCMPKSILDCFPRPFLCVLRFFKKNFSFSQKKRKIYKFGDFGRLVASGNLNRSAWSTFACIRVETFIWVSGLANARSLVPKSILGRSPRNFL